MRAARHVAALCLLLLVLYPCASASSAVESVLTWVRRHEGVVRVKEGPAARLLVAASAVPYGGVALAIPLRLGVDLGPTHHSAPQLALAVFQRQADNASWYRAGLAPYWASIKSELYCKEVWEHKYLELLQDPQLAAYVQAHADETRQVYAERLAPSQPAVSFAEFAHRTAHVATYSFAFNGRRYLLPVLDLLNHSDEPNTYVERAPVAGVFRAVAKRALLPGEEVTFAYSWGLARNDYSLVNSWFLQRKEPPLLCQLDLPGQGLPWLELPGSDTDEAFSPATRAEAARLLQRLSGWPSSELQDRHALALLGPARGQPSLDVLRQLLNFRVLRKEALRLRLQRISRLLREAGEASST